MTELARPDPSHVEPGNEPGPSGVLVPEKGVVRNRDNHSKEVVKGHNDCPGAHRLDGKARGSSGAPEYRNNVKDKRHSRNTGPKKGTESPTAKFQDDPTSAPF